MNFVRNLPAFAKGKKMPEKRAERKYGSDEKAEKQESQRTGWREKASERGKELNVSRTDQMKPEKGIEQKGNRRAAESGQKTGTSRL